MARVKDLWFSEVKRADGSVERRKTKRHPDLGGNRAAKRWLAIWIGPDGREKSKAFEKKINAENHGKGQEADQLRGVYVDSRKAATKLRDYALAKWLPAQLHVRENTTDTYERHLRNHIIPAFGDWQLGRIEQDDVQNWVIALTKKPATSDPNGPKLSPATIETIYTVLRMLLQSAVPKVIPFNPCKDVNLPDVEQRVVEPLPIQAVLDLADAITPRYRLLVLLAAMAGLREGEAFGLTVSKVDFLRRRIYVHQQAQKGRLVELKSKASKRSVPADDMLLAEITNHMQEWAPGPGGVIVTNRFKVTVQRSSFGSCWRPAVKAVGLPKGTRFHDLRHFYASGLIKANLNPKVIQTRLGHATISETMDTYGHLFPEDEDLGRGAIESLINSAAEQRQNREAK
jgi:integrase